MHPPGGTVSAVIAPALGVLVVTAPGVPAAGMAPAR